MGSSDTVKSGGEVPAYPQPPSVNAIKKETVRTRSRSRNVSENCEALGRALHRGASLRDRLLRKMFMAAHDKRTRCAKAAQDWQSRNHGSHAQGDAPEHRQTPQSEMV